jgi:endonuclease YncB( thermonuclease family)
MLRHIKMALAAAIGLMIVAALVSAPSSLAPKPDVDSGTGLALEVPDDSEQARVSAKPALPGSVSGGIARNVGGGLIAAADVTGGSLERIEALPQPAMPAPAEAKKPNTIMRWKLVYNSVISAAGVFELNGNVLVLPGIDIVSANETCSAPDGTRWPCGMVARTAFRNYVKGRAITCRMPDAPSQQSAAAECLLAGQDMAAWLVEQGWAHAKPATLYTDLETAAKNSKRGIHGNPPRGVEAVSQTAVIDSSQAETGTKP